MKKLTYIFLTLLVLAGCTGTSRQPELVAMDSLLLSRPDSALTLLRGMSFTDKADRMYHYLLLADACNKCYDTLPSDSILQEVADYYDRHGSANEQVRAHYLLGCTYRDEGNAPLALKCYRNAVDRADLNSPKCDFKTLSRVNGQIAILYHMQRSPRLEIEARREAIKYAWLAKDTVSAIIFTGNLSNPYHMLNNLDSSLFYSQQAASLFRSVGRKEMAARTLGLDIEIYLRQKHYTLAKQAMEEYERNSLFFDQQGNIAKGRESYYNYKGIYYEGIGKFDSATYYYRKLLLGNANLNEREAAYKGLLSIYQKLNNGDSIAKYSELYCQTNDSASFTHSADEITRMQAMYNYTRHQEIARKAEQKAERARTGIVAILAVGVVILAIGAFFYQQYRNKKKAEIQQLNYDYGRALLEYNKLSAELERMKQQDGSLMLDKQQEVEELKARLQAYQAALQTNGPSQQLSVFQESSIMQTFRTKSRVSPQTPLPTETEWKRLVSQFSRALPYAYAALGRDVILSTNELRVCILLLSGFKIADVAVLLDTSPQSITNLKARANNKLFGESSASTLERNLMNTVGLA